MEWNMYVTKQYDFSNRQLSVGTEVGEGNVLPDTYIITTCSLQNFDFFQ